MKGLPGLQYFQSFVSVEWNDLSMPKTVRGRGLSGSIALSAWLTALWSLCWKSEAFWTRGSPFVFCFGLLYAKNREKGGQPPAVTWSCTYYLFLFLLLERYLWAIQCQLFLWRQNLSGFITSCLSQDSLPKSSLLFLGNLGEGVETLEFVVPSNNSHVVYEKVLGANSWWKKNIKRHAV